RSLRVKRVVDTQLSGKEVPYFYYDCDKPYLKGGGKCSGCSMPVDLLDRGVAEYIIELIRDPSVVDKKIRKLLAANPAQKQQQKTLPINKKCNYNRNNCSSVLLSFTGNVKNGEKK